jgi:protein-glutamine gamma-glutamyltransferase
MLHQRLLQITMAAMAALGTTLLSMGQRDVVLPLVMILAAGSSVWLTDVRGLLRLNRTLSNIAMIAAAVVSLRYLIIGGEIQAIGFARLLIYLQIIVLFQNKDSRSYWLLIMLSLLQVIVATLFSQGIIFGLMLIVYMLITSLGLTLLLLKRQFEQFAPSEKSAVIAGGGRWPLTGRKVEFSGAPAGHIDVALGREIFRRLSGIGMRTVGVTVVLFIFLPRFGQFGWIGSIMQTTQTVGFNDKVNLGEFGRIIENPDEVMRIRFFNNADNTPYVVHGAIYLRGAVLMDYYRGQWNAGEPAASIGNQTLSVPIKPHYPPDLVSQECIIEGLDRPELFYVAPYVPIQSDLYIEEDESQLRLLRADHLCNTRYKYKLGTTALVNGAQVPLVPGNEKEDVWVSPLRMAPPDKMHELPNLVRLARQWIEESKLPETDRVGRARYLEKKLSTSDLFRYSLTGQQRDPAIDPIEDFLTNNREGHCEYFATALTLMLRSLNIPARMVVGYRTDEWNGVGQCYQVRQLHAHTWVECWLRGRQIPPELLHGKDLFKWSADGGWLQLDPTPESEAREQTSWYSPVTKTMQWFNYVWSYYVVELNYERQSSAIFQPIFRAAKYIYKLFTDRQTWRDMYGYFHRALRLSGLPGAIAWGLFFLTVLSVAALTALVCWLIWRQIDKIWRKISGCPAKRRRGPQIEVEFYRRLEAILAARGLVRAAGQTQREFAALAGFRLADISGDAALVSLPVGIADAFYLVRFGRLPLDNAQAETVEQALDKIAACERVNKSI